MSNFGDLVRAGLILTPIPYGHKSPVTHGWNQRENCIDDPEVADCLDGNAGICHAYSGTACVDIDDGPKADEWFKARGIDIAALCDAPDAVLISSGREGRAKILYRVEKPLPTFNLSGTHGFELRCQATTGRTVQDVAPGSIHPDTDKPYVWAGAGDFRNIPMMPVALHALWTSMIKPDIKQARERAEKPVALPALQKLIGAQDPNVGYDDWIRVGMAIHYETGGADAGLQLWDDWSSAGDKYKGISDLETHWRSFHADASVAVTARSLVKDQVAGDDEFTAITDEDVQTATAVIPTERQEATELAKELAELDRDKGGNAFATLPNTLAVMSRPEICGYDLRLDEFKHEIMLRAADEELGWRALRDTDLTAARIWLEENARFYPVSKEIVRDTIHYIGEQNKMDSAQEWLTSLTWDGVDRVNRFMPDYFGTLDGEYERHVGLYLWTAMAGRVMQPGCQVDMCPILVGRQGIGKSQGIKAMVPDPSFYVEVRLDEKDDDIARKIRGTLIGEIAELRGLRSADLDRIKAFITRTHEKWTPKYMEHSTTFARRLVMVGTTNEDEFLADTENRRWLPVRCIRVNVAAIQRDMEQLWAQAYEMWLAQGILWQRVEKLAGPERVEYEVGDSWEQAVGQWLADNPGEHTTAELLSLALGYDARQITRTQEHRMGRIMRELGYTKRNKRHGHQVLKTWVLDVTVDDVLA